MKKSEWFLLTGLLALSLIPSVGGLVRLLDLGTGWGLIPGNPRVLAAPVPVVYHIVGSVLFCILGAFQFLPSVRNRYPRWHRCAGRILMVAGVVSALSGLWMTHFYAFPDQLQGKLLYGVRVVVSVSVALFILLALRAVLRKAISRHQAWMIRAYALAQGAGTQSLLMLPWALAMGEPAGFGRDLLMTVAWLINLIVAEWAIRKSRQQRPLDTMRVDDASDRRAISPPASGVLRRDRKSVV